MKAPQAGACLRNHKHRGNVPAIVKKRLAERFITRFGRGDKFGVMLAKSDDEFGEALTAADPAEAFLGYEQGCRPAQYPIRVAPPIDPARPRLGTGEAAIDEVGGTEAAPQQFVHGQPVHGQRCLQTFFQAPARVEADFIQPFHRGFEFFERLFRGGLAHTPRNRQAACCCFSLGRCSSTLRSMCTRQRWISARSPNTSWTPLCRALPPSSTTRIADEVKESRNQTLLRLLDGTAEARLKAMVGQRVQILVEGPSKRNAARLAGRTRCNKIVIFDGDEARHRGQLLDVEIERAGSFTLYGNPAILME